MLRAPWQCGTSSFSTGDPATSMASSSVSQSPMCHCLVLEIIQFLGTVETPCLQEPSDTSPLLILPLFEFAKLTDTAEVVACCAAFLSSSLEASSEDIKGRKTSMISSWLAVWTAITSSRNIHGVRWHQALLAMDFVRKWLKFSEPTWIHESMWFVQGQELEGSLDFAASWDSTSMTHQKSTYVLRCLMFLSFTSP